jgi:predicted Zn-dependent protease
MGELIPSSSHEVGHTLGLRHNMGRVLQPVEKLRDKDYKQKNGHTSSINGLCPF